MNRWYRHACPAVLLAAALLALALLSPAAAEDEWTPDIILDGTGDPAIDVPAVQAAADAGGNILLRGTFDFGVHQEWCPFPANYYLCFLTPVVSRQGGTVVVGRLGNDADIRGEGEGVEMTTILNGYKPVICGPGAHCSIRNLSFQGPTLYGIWLNGCEGADVVGNRIHDVKPAMDPYSGFYISLALGVALTDAGGEGPGWMTGDVNIERNDMLIIVDEDIALFQGAGVELWRLLPDPDRPELNVRIHRNTIRYPYHDNIYIAGSGGATVEVTHNDLYQKWWGNEIVAYPEGSLITGGIVVIARLYETGAPYIAHNRIHGARHRGIHLDTRDDGAVVEHNTIEMDNPDAVGWSSGIQVADITRGATIRANRIEGAGLWAIHAGGIDVDTGDMCSGNVFIGNNVNAFVALNDNGDGAKVLLDAFAVDNVYVGRGESVWDQPAGAFTFYVYFRDLLTGETYPDMGADPPLVYHFPDAGYENGNLADPMTRDHQEIRHCYWSRDGITWYAGGWSPPRTEPMITEDLPGWLGPIPDPEGEMVRVPKNNSITGVDRAFGQAAADEWTAGQVRDEEEPTP